MRRLPSLVSLTFALATPPAIAAPMGPDTEAVAVLLIEADPGQDVAAKAMTNALRQRVLDSAEYTLHGASDPLIATAHAVGCSLKGWKHPLTAANENVFDVPCLRRVGAELRARRFFWGLAYAEGGTTFMRLHLWQDGKSDRAATLPYDAAHRDRIADRLYKKLVTPNAVGDLKIVGGPEGEIVVDSKPAGAYVSGTELTLETGEHFLEVRDGPRVLARGRTRIEPGGRSEATMMPVAEPAPAPTAPPLPRHAPPPTTVREKASAWPWVLGGVGVAGLAGAGVFWGLRQGERADLEGACFEKACLERDNDAVDRGRTWTALSAVSLGVGAAGAGLAVYLLTARRVPPVSGAVVPLKGGAVAAIGGSF